MKHIVAIGQQSVVIAAHIRSYLPHGPHIEYYYHFFHTSIEKRTMEKDSSHYFYTRVFSLWSEGYTATALLYAAFTTQFQLNPGDVFLIYDIADAMGSGGASFILDKLSESHPTVCITCVPIFVSAALAGPSALNALLSLHSCISLSTAIVPRSLLDSSYLLALMKRTSYQLPLLLEIAALDILHLLLAPLIPLISSNKIIDIRAASWYNLLKPPKRTVTAAVGMSQLHRRICSNVHAIDDYTANSLANTSRKYNVRAAHVITTEKSIDNHDDALIGMLKGAAQHTEWPACISSTSIACPTLAAPLCTPLAALCFTSPYALQQLQAVVFAAEECVHSAAYTHWYVKSGISVETLGIAVDAVKDYLQEADRNLT